ncbi:MAG: energy-coupled thiamine transporter ThiT [Clostridia bacterium]|nr:hypothetical protein [Oscillospiraceae bacterium]MBQ6797332.1 energy-coupled thiamine transporter ThiT [Clostridia bacterium]
MKKNTKTTKLVVSALMIALGTVLSLLSIGLPFGGSVTMGAMVPLVVLSQTYGTAWGLFACSVYGLLQLVLGLDNFAYATTLTAVLVLFVFDYVVAYGMVGFSGLTRNMKNKAAAGALGAVIGCAIRFVMHCVSGAVVWGQWADVTAIPSFLHNTFLTSEDFLIYSYSFFYNLSYMLPETVLTAIAAAIICPILRKSNVLGE